jgi:ribosomal-protein-alanine N-acetyltransferase
MDARYQIRPAEAADVGRVIEIEGEVFSTPWPAASFYSFIGPCFLVLEVDRLLVGYGVGRVAVEEGEVLNLALKGSHQRRGLGSRLLLTLVHRLADNGAEEVFLEVRESNRAAIGLYCKLGFVEVGRRRSYYADPVEDALVLRLKIAV